MFFKTYIAFLGFIALHTSCGHRVVRSPDKMEIDIPHREPDRGEYKEEVDKETEYWHGQGDKYEDKGKEGHKQIDDDRKKNNETYHHEKEHHQENQETYSQGMNETYHQDRDKLESHHGDNQDHIQEHEKEYDVQGQGNQTMHAVTESADRYEEIGNEYREEGEDAIQNYEPGDGPSITYTRD